MTHKFQTEAEALATESCKWIEVPTDLLHGYCHDLWRWAGDLAQMIQEKVWPMLSCLRSIVRGRRNSPSRRVPEEIEAPLGQLAMAIEAPNQRFMIYDRAEVVRADIFMPLDRYGSLAVYRAYVRLKDEPHEETAV